MGKPLNDLAGRQFGFVSVLRRAGSYKGKATWVCRCKCGREWTVIGSALVRGGTQSCGCETAGIISAKRRKDAQIRRGDKVYNAWLNMKARCLRPTNKMFYRYGQRGVTIHPEWVNSFAAFRDYLGPPPTAAYTLERIDNDGNYQPGNVEWATRKAQAHNQTRGGAVLSAQGEGNIKAKLREADVRVIRDSSESGPILAAKFGVSRTVISQIRLRKIWKHVT